MPDQKSAKASEAAADAAPEKPAAYTVQQMHVAVTTPDNDWHERVHAKYRRSDKAHRDVVDVPLGRGAIDGALALASARAGHPVKRMSAEEWENAIVAFLEYRPGSDADAE